MTQQEYNIKIAEYILAKCRGEDGSDLRFHQLLFNLNINEFSDETVEKMHKNPIKEWYPNTLKDKYNESSKLTYDKLIKKNESRTNK